MTTTTTTTTTRPMVPATGDTAAHYGHKTTLNKAKTAGGGDIGVKITTR